MRYLLNSVCSLLVLGHVLAVQAADPLPSWNDTPARQSIIRFVERVTTAGAPDYVPPEARIATFDNDGTLWSEKPAYFQLLFAIDRVRELAADRPEWKDKPPFKYVLENDLSALAGTGAAGMAELLMATHAGMTSDEFGETVSKWLATARHPQLQRPYTELVFQPMLELLEYLRANGFKTYIVSGGGIEFIRAFAEEVYGIPPEQVIGSTVKTQFQLGDGEPVIVRVAEVDFINDKAGKPVAINKHIGRRPIMAFGNSDGDLQMLQWTAAGPGPRFCLFVRHTDGEREWAYDRQSHIGQLDVGLDEARRRSWTVVDMRQDWKVIFPAGK